MAIHSVDLKKDFDAMKIGLSADMRTRIHRSLSWLKRSESQEDVEGRFISLWVAFNAAYGYLDDFGLSAADHASFLEFLEKVVLADTEDRIRPVLFERFQAIRNLSGNQYLYNHFWSNVPDWRDRFDRENSYLCSAIGRISIRNETVDHKKYVVGVLSITFRRLYVLRCQIFHGGATCGSRYNRLQLHGAVDLMSRVIPAMLAVMIDVGDDLGLGPIAFPAIAHPNHRVDSILDCNQNDAGGPGK